MNYISTLKIKKASLLLGLFLTTFLTTSCPAWAMYYRNPDVEETGENMYLLVQRSTIRNPYDEENSSSLISFFKEIWLDLKISWRMSLLFKENILQAFPRNPDISHLGIMKKLNRIPSKVASIISKAPSEDREDILKELWPTLLDDKWRKCGTLDIWYACIPIAKINRPNLAYIYNFIEDIKKILPEELAFTLKKRRLFKPIESNAKELKDNAEKRIISNFHNAKEAKKGIGFDVNFKWEDE